MNMITYIPRAPLSEFVEVLWLVENSSAPAFKESCLPTGTMELVINLSCNKIYLFDEKLPGNSEKYSGAILCGIHSKPFVIENIPHEVIIGAHFKPGGAFPFLQTPLTEIHNIHLSLDTLWGQKGNDLREQLLEANTAENRFLILETALMLQARTYLHRHPSLTFALKKLQTTDQLKITDMVKDIGLSQRQFTRVFLRDMGITPKMYARIQRFQKVLSFIEEQKHQSWTGTALDFGYYDQAHFNHDFKMFSGISPSAYLQRTTDRINHILLSH